MEIRKEYLFTIVATALNEMQKHPDDFEFTLPIAKEILTNIFTKWEKSNEILIDKLPF